MKKTLLLILFLLPFLGFSQIVDLVKWDSSSNFNANILVPTSQVSAPAITGSNLINSNYAGYASSQWPGGNSINPAKYIQIGIKAQPGYKIDLSALKYAYIPSNGSDSPRKYQVRYSRSSSFPANGTLLLDTKDVLSGRNNEQIYFDTGFTLLPEEEIYFRFYGFAMENAYYDGGLWGLVNSLISESGRYYVPTITGTVSPYIPTLTANNDTATTIQNNFTVINVLNNDLAGTNPISSVDIQSPPANGTVVVNPDNKIKFTPATDFVGLTSFTYRIGDGTNTSTATVNVTVNAPTTSSLVEWNGPDDTIPNIIAPTNAVAADPFTVGPGTTLQLQPKGDGYNGYGWPTQFTIDESKYFEFTTSAKTGYKLKLNKFNFTYTPDANHFIARYQVRYSKDDFATSFILEDEATNTGKTNKSLDLSNVTLYPDEKITIRIYGYKLKSREYPDSPIFLANTVSKGPGGTVPTITGTVLNYDTTDLNANDDLVSTQEKRAISFNPLTNDINTSGATITFSQPPTTSGTVSANGNVFIFTPNDNFKGITSFTYTLTKGTQTSTATVVVYVNELTPRLIIWNGAVQTTKAVVTDPNVIGNDLTVGGNGVGLRLDLNEFYMTGLQNGGSTAENLSRYMQVSVTPKQKYNLTLTQFKFIYNSPSGDQGASMFQVRYSKDPNFADNGTVLLGPTAAVKGTDREVTINFPSGTRVLSNTNETFYIRIYPYAVLSQSNGYFIIKNSDGGDIGPTITGVVEPSNLITAVADVATVSSTDATPIPILANDENYTPLVSISTTQPTVGGTVQVNGTTNVIFTPTPGFTGTSTFDYTIYNGLNYSTATVTLNVSCQAPGNQTAFGDNEWIGYVYKLANTAPMPPNTSYPALPSSTIATYIGRVTENKTFDRDMDAGPVSGLTTEIPCEAAPTDRFLVRYKMHVDITEAGLYHFDLGSDDGVALYINEVEVLREWYARGYVTNSFTRNLDVGSYDFVLEYYEDGGLARNSFFFGLPKGDPSEFGDKVWNVYGYENGDLSLNNVKYAGYYVDPNPSPDSRIFWPVDKSPSAAAIWQGVRIPDNNFTTVYKRKGFECGRYELQNVTHDDAIEIYIDGTPIYSDAAWNPNYYVINSGTLYALNSNSRVEIRVREDAGDANLAINFVKVDVEHNGGPIGTLQSGSSLVIKGNTRLASDLTVCSCTVDPTYTLTVPEGVTLTVDENITVKAGGKLLVESGGSLLQTSTSKTMFTGDEDSFEIQRTTSVRRYDLTYWSMPVTKEGFTMYNLSPATLVDKYFYFDPVKGDWAVNGKGTMKMKTGQGYSIRAPQNFSITDKADFTAHFTGIPNNGDIPADVVEGKWNLIGNPYPSAISAKQLLDDNEDLGTLYFWAHTNLPVKSTTDQYIYYTDDFVAYNGLGGIGFNGYIAAAQGFLIKAPAATTTVKFNNNQRRLGNNKQFFKTAESETDRHRIWLNMTNATGAIKQILVGYIQGATNTTDAKYDGLSMASSGVIDFYSINNSKKLMIQGRAMPFSKSDLVPFGYTVTAKGDYTVSIDHADGIFNENQEVYLEDKTTGKITNLRLADYKFTSEKGTFNSRLVLRYTNSTLGTDDFENATDGVFVSVKNKVISISSSNESINEVSVYNLLGQEVFNKKKINSNDLEISNLQTGNQVLLVKTALENGSVSTKKIIMN
ncbi:Ig-like domain-containing protein [Flavobacterium notoginsengisoli]|uniref:Ig-like domain-containing protein n=1 Tax=Flavobacterium notoginsengisoli TaxID=1478199 RepID=UPI003629FF63